jgi:hypothetical protein
MAMTVAITTPCPVCQKDREIATIEAGVKMPYLLQEKAKKEYNENNQKGGRK